MGKNLTLTKSEHAVIATLRPGHYDLVGVFNLEPFLKAGIDMLPGEITHAGEERLDITYHLPEYAQSVSEAAATGKLSDRLELARKLSALGVWQTRVACPYLHPDNLFVAGGQLKVAHRGLAGYVAPKTQGKDSFFALYRVLAVSTIQPKYNFELLVTGKIIVRDPFCLEIMGANSVEEIESLLDKRIYELRQADKTTKRVVNKSGYILFKSASIVFALCTIILGIWLLSTIRGTVSQQDRIIESHAAFLAGDFAGTSYILSGDNPETLPRATQYILAASFVRLDNNLSPLRRNDVLMHLAPYSSEIELLYWIHSGRGEFYQALDIALNIGDNRLMLHAYSNLYAMVDADMTMPGAEKQRLLSAYRARINELTAQIYGEQND